MDKKLLKIINYYGVNNQQRKLEEEVFELQEAITQKNQEGILEELADVFVILNQLAVYYCINEENLYNMMNYKINRTINRMEEEYGDSL